ncbi:MAG TPA: hypothetical protein VFQ78_12930 [Candidatus Udaeobacter sp.]|jgi:hypothetical protein|nr:hypothetical protein [Candidatus Udaeobacter sp.]
MRNWLTVFVGIFALSTSAVMRADTDAEVNARKDALEVAGAFSNDGFKIRDGHSCGTLKQHDHSLVTVNLYAGNQYWFSVGTVEPVKKVAVSVYDEAGKQMTTENYSNGEKAAAGFAPENSGQYFVAIDLVEGQEGSFCLVYSYK